MHRYGKYQDMAQEITALTYWKLEASVSLTPTAWGEKTEYLQRSPTNGKMLFKRILKTLKQQGIGPWYCTYFRLIRVLTARKRKGNFSVTSRVKNRSYRTLL